MAWGIDNVNLVVFPEAGNRGGNDGNTALAFLGHPVSGGFAFVNGTNLVLQTGAVQNTFGRGGLTGINMRNNARCYESFPLVFSCLPCIILIVYYMLYVPIPLGTCNSD